MASTQRAHRPASRRARNHNRNGAMLAEFAVCLPILLLFFFGLWEYSRMEIIRQTVRAAAFEGSRQGIVVGATEDEMEETAQRWLDAFAIRDATIVTALDDETAAVDIEVGLYENSYSAAIFGKNTKVRSRIQLFREAYSG